MPKFEVLVDWTYSGTKRVRVNAESEDQAIEIVQEKLDDGMIDITDEDFNWSHEELETVEAIEWEHE